MIVEYYTAVHSIVMAVICIIRPKWMVVLGKVYCLKYTNKMTWHHIEKKVFKFLPPDNGTNI